MVSGGNQLAAGFDCRTPIRAADSCNCFHISWMFSIAKKLYRTYERLFDQIDNRRTAESGEEMRN
jgi:hypothetical protein